MPAIVRDDFLRAIEHVESGGDPNAVSPKGAIGLMQVMPETGAEMGYTPEQLRDPETNREAGAKYMGQLADKFGGNEYLMAAAYNAGPRRVQRWLTGEVQNLPQETYDYVSKVSAHLAGASTAETDNRFVNYQKQRDDLETGYALAQAHPDVAQQFEAERQRIEGPAPELEPTQGPIEGALYSLLGAKGASTGLEMLRGVAGTAAFNEYIKKASELGSQLFPNHPQVAGLIGQILGTAGAVQAPNIAAGVSQIPEAYAGSRFASETGGIGGGTPPKTPATPPEAPEAAAPNISDPPPIDLTPQAAAQSIAGRQAEALQKVKVGKGVAAELGRPELATEVSEADTLALARETRAYMERAFTDTPISEPPLRADTAAMVQIYSDEAQALHQTAQELMQRANAGEDINAPLTELQNRYAAFAVNYARVAGVRSGAGRALEILNPLKPENIRITETAKLAQQLGESNNPAELLQALAELTPDRIPRMARQVAESVPSGNLLGGLMEYYRANLLSNPKTINRIGFSNAITTLSEVPVRAVAARLPAATVQAGEASAMLRGLTDGFWDSLKYGFEVAKGTDPEFMNTGIQYVERPASITSQGTRFQGTNFGTAIDYLGNMIRLPFRGVAGIHQFGRATAISMQMHALAWRQALASAAEQGLEGKAAWDFAEDAYGKILQDPPTDLLNSARDYGDVATFINELGPRGQKINAALNAVPGARIVLPFFHVPYNVFKFGLDYVPGLNIASQWGALKAGGAAGDAAKAKIALSALMAGMMAHEAISGRLTGDGPSNPTAREAWLRDGNQPNSYRVGGHWFEIPEPFRMPMTLVANGVEIMHELDDPTAAQVATGLTISLARAFSNAPMVQGLVNLRDAFQNMQEQGLGQAAERYVGRTAAGFVPASALLRGMKGVADPELRQAQDWLEEIKSRIPGLSESLPPKRDIYGDPVATLPGVPANLIWPIRITAEKPDPVDQEIIDNEPQFARVPKYISGRARHAMDNPNNPDLGVQLTPDEQDRWAVERGTGLKDDLTKVIKNPGYQRLSQAGKRQMLEWIAAKHAEVATAKLLASDRDLQQRWVANQKLKAGKMLPESEGEGAGGNLGTP